MEYVNEVINPLQMMNWGESSKIFIDAPMGSGKSHWVKTQLIPRAIQQGKKVLILCNRVNLRDAYSKEIADSFYDWLLRGMIPYQQQWVTVETYQALAKIWNASAWISSFPVIVCDEVHAFYSDSTFAPEMYEAYKAIIMGCQNSLTAFISATSDCIFPQIQVDLRCVAGALNIEYQTWGERTSLFPQTYSLDPDFTYLDVHYAQNVDQIINVILQDRGSLDKWLILVPSVKEGKIIAEELHKGGYENNEMFFLNKKNSSTNGATIKDNLTLTESFDVKILITTSIIEAGISIKDTNLRNVVDLHFTKEAFIQSLGRKRVSNGERVRLYLMNRAPGFFKRKLMGSKRALDEYGYIKDCEFRGNQRQYYDAFANLFMQPENVSKVKTYAYLHTCYDNGGYWIEPAINPFSIVKHLNDCQFFETMIVNLSYDGAAFLRCQMEWLGLDYDSGTWLEVADGVQEKNRLCAEMITQKLRVYANAESMDSSTFKKLREETTEILHEFMPKEYRRDRTIGSSTLDAVLVKWGIPFEVKKARTNSATRYKIVPIISVTMEQRSAI